LKSIDTMRSSAGRQAARGVGDDVAGHQPATRPPALALLALAGRQLVHLVEHLRPRRHRLAAGGDRLGVHVAHELEGQHRGLADQRLGALRILDAGQLDHDVALALPLDDRLAHAELVDAVADGLQRLVDGRFLDLRDSRPATA
jgi:hypothetical protein